MWSYMKPQQEYNHTLEKLTIRVEGEDPQPIDAVIKLPSPLCSVVGKKSKSFKISEARLLMAQNYL